MKKFISIIIISFFFQIGHAQNLIQISGKVIEESSQENLPFASVSLLDGNYKIISGSISDGDGRFIIKGYFSGEYIIRASFIGYESVDQSILIGELNADFDIGKISLRLLKNELDEVSVEGQRAIISSGLDQKTFNMSDYMSQSAGSVLEVMKMMPGITVDQEGKIILRGSDKVIVLIDGKQSSITGIGSQKGLDNIPVSNIEKIEIINNPSAKYDAAGMAGIVNIIYKKETQKGLNSELGMAYGLGSLTKVKADLPTDLGSYSPTPKYIPSLNLNYRTEKINLFLQSEVLFQNKLPNNEFTTRNYDDGRITASQVPENRTQQHYITRGGFDWYINQDNTITLSGVYDWEKHVDTAQVAYINMNTVDRYRYWSWKEVEITGFMNYSVNFNHKFAEAGHEIDVNAQYIKGWEDETYNLNDSSEYRQGDDATHILATEYTGLITSDYIKPLRSGRLEAGLKAQYRFIPVDYDVTPGFETIIYPNMGSWSEWGENMFAAYLNYVFEKEKYSIEGGLRAEYTDVFYDINPENVYYLENDSYSYFEWFPNIRLSLRINESNSLSAFYNRRIDRPGEPELRIFPKYDDPELLKVGNPYLRPQFTQSLELAYRMKWSSGSVYLAGFYRITEDPFMRIYAIDTTETRYDIVNKIYQNTGKAYNKGFEILLSQRFGNFWKISAGLNYYQNEIDAYSGTMLFPYVRSYNLENSKDNTWDMKISNQFDLKNEIQIQITGLYYAPKNIAQGRQLSRSSIDIGVSKKVFKSKGEVFITAGDIFNKFGLRQEVQGEGFAALYENYYETQSFRLGMKYKF